MALFWTKTWDALAGVLFPTPCLSCGALIAAHDPPLCPKCWDLLPRQKGGLCPCGSPLGALGTDRDREDGGTPELVCGRCRRGLSVISRGAALGPYGGALRDCVVALKYRGRHRTAERLALRLVRNPRCQSVLKTAEVITAVPLHEARLRGRGFNQADLLADALARPLGLRRSTALMRTRDTPSQTHLSARARRRNLVGAFTLAPGHRLNGTIVVLVDDVVTTGATLRECATTLLDAGVREVRAVTVARAE